MRVSVRQRLLPLLVVSVVFSAALACSDDDEGPGTAGSGGGGERLHGLTADERAATLAKIGDRTISVGEFAEIVAEKGPFLAVRYNSPERRRELLDQLVRFELLANEADARGFDDLPEVRRARQQIIIRRFLKREYEDRFRPEDVSDADVAAYYEAHATEFHTPAQVRVSHILFSSEAAARRVLRQVLGAPTDVRLFRALAEEHNTDPASRDRFGDIGFVSRPDERRETEPSVPPEVVNAAFALETIGGVSTEVIQSSAGFHIVKLTGRRSAVDRTLEEASRPIRHRLFRERREAAIEELITQLRSAADVEEHLEVLDAIELELPPPGVTPTGGALDPTLPPTPVDEVGGPVEPGGPP